LTTAQSDPLDYRGRSFVYNALVGLDSKSWPSGVHFGAQTRITYRHPRWPTVLRIFCLTFDCFTSGYPGLRILFTENPRVGCSIDAAHPCAAPCGRTSCVQICSRQICHPLATIL